jgi:Uma2 family endonuclease
MPTVRTTRRRTSQQVPPPAAAGGRLAVKVPTSAMTLEGFRAWARSPGFPEQGRISFLDGEIFIDMSNESPETHVAVKTEATRVLASLTRELGDGKFYGDGVLLSNEKAGLSNNPDGVFFTGKSLQAERVRLVPREGEEGTYRELEGTPDWVMEVVSDSSVEKDTERLRRAYHKAGVPEYWLIDARGEQISFQILYWRKTGYAAAPVRDGWQRSRVFGRAFRLERQRDALGLWEYTLHVQPA